MLFFFKKISRTSTGFNSIRNKFNTMKYEEIYTSIDQPEAFWAAQADEIEWYSKPETILSKDENGYPLVKDDGIEYLLSHIRQAYSRWIWRSNRLYL
jgi:hypothetical protein